MSEPALRASDAEREHAVELLGRHSVDGRLTLEEFAERIGRAYESRTREQLDELTKDLPAETPAVEVRSRKKAGWIVSIMSGAHRRGRFYLGAGANVVTFMGGANIDLRQAEIDQPEVAITVVAFMGGVNIVVPEGVDVELSGFAFMGGKAYRPGKQPLPRGAPLLRVRVFAFMGGVSVTTKR